MKKQILTLALALFLGTAVGMAQENRGERPDPSKRIEQMVTDLGLNETQAKEFKAVMEEMRPNRDASGERPSREEMEKKRNEADAKLKKILTDEQYKKYQSMRPQRGQRLLPRQWQPGTYLRSGYE